MRDRLQMTVPPVALAGFKSPQEPPRDMLVITSTLGKAYGVEYSGLKRCYATTQHPESSSLLFFHPVFHCLYKYLEITGIQLRGTGQNT